MPTTIDAMGGKLYVEDNSETPDTMLATFQYPKFLSSYELRSANPLPMFGMNQGAGSMIHGTEATIFVNRSQCRLIANDRSKGSTVWEENPQMSPMNIPHWKNWLECIRTRQKPTSEIETCVRSSAVCILANVAMRSKLRLDWDENNWTVAQAAAKQMLKAKYRAPWKLEV
jgi:hypothetical protein